MNALICDNIRKEALKLINQLERQIIDPDTSKEELEKLIEAQQSLGGTVRFLMQAIGMNVERWNNRRKVCR